MAEPPAANIYPCLCYEDAERAIDWLCTNFGFEKRCVVPGPNGTVRHSELSFETGVIFVNTARAEEGRAAPGRVSGQPQMLSVFVRDLDAHYARTKASGAELIDELGDLGFGARGYTVRDLEGHLWHFSNYRPGIAWQDDA